MMQVIKDSVSILLKHREQDPMNYNSAKALAKDLTLWSGQVAKRPRNVCSTVTELILEEVKAKLKGKCAYCGDPASKKCAKCKKAFYCSSEHQKMDLQKHKDNCVSIKRE